MSNELDVATRVMANAIESLSDLIDGKLTGRTLDLGSHEMHIVTREKEVKEVPPVIPETIK